MQLQFATIFEVGRKIRQGEISSLALTELMLERIEKHNPTLNAYITVTGDLATKQAGEADRELKEGRDRGPLHGIPIGIKDLFYTKDVRTTSGSRLFENFVPNKNAKAVDLLERAGCVFLGKTGMHELAYGGSSINPFYGSIANPWKLTHDPGGSSGGSASAVAAGLAYGALGSDTGCSIRQPAHCCGIVGHKPTFGLVSKAGAYPLVESMDHAGPITRCVQDAAIMLDALAGVDHTDPYSRPAPEKVTYSNFEPFLEGTKIGVIRRFFFDGYPEVICAVNRALKTLEECGAELVELDVPDIEEAYKAAGTTFVEALVQHQDNLTDLPELFSEEVRGKLEDSASTTAAQYISAQRFRRDFTQRMENLLNEVDVLAAPTATIAASLIDKRPDDYPKNAWKNTGIFDFTGQPSISIPCGFTSDALPVGLMLTGQLFQDKHVLGVAAAAEEKLQFDSNSPPGF